MNGEGKSSETPPNTTTAPTSPKLGSKHPQSEAENVFHRVEVPGVATLDVEGFPVSHLS